MAESHAEGLTIRQNRVSDALQYGEVSSSERDVKLLPNDILPSTSHRKANIFLQTQNVIYKSILDTIRSALENDGGTSPASNTSDTLSVAGGILIEKASDTRRELDRWASTAMNSRIHANGVDQQTIVFTAVNESGAGDEYLLGYSNNIFGSHTKYIEKLSGEITQNSQHYQSSNTLHSGQQRRKRSVLHLYNMVLCATGCDPLSYKGYGCYCGFLGSGYVVDGIDRCCKIHDWCYDTAGCPMFLEYFIPYLWKCYNHHYPVCAIDHGEFGGPGSCAQRLCECDRQLAQCLKMYPCPSSKALCTSSPLRLLQNIIMN